MKKKLFFLLLALLALSTTALAAQHADGDGTVWETDGTDYYALEAPAPMAAALAKEAALTPLGDPSNLRWNPETPGEALWETTGLFQRKLTVSFYRVGGPEEPLLTTRHNFGINHYSEFSANDFHYGTGADPHNVHGDPLTTGDYYFTVQNLGDGVTYGDSAVVSSLDLPGGVYHYVEPAMDTTLETPQAGHWQWPAAIWDDRQKEDERIKTYYINYGYSETPAHSPEDIRSIGGTFSSTSGDEDSWLQDRLIGEHGAGWYYFRIRPISAGIEQWRNGAFSPWSEGYNLLEASKKITDSLNAIDKTKPENIRPQVQALNRTELANALTADIQGAETGTEAALTALEEALGGPARPTVAPELADAFDVKGVSIVGAALNNVTGSEAPALNIGRPKQDNHVRDENYNNTLAVDFSMELSGVESPHDLAVPVKVTLPVPAGVNPDFLAVLHYRADGSFEETHHTVFEKDGQWYVSFVLTSFSDFALTEKGTQGDGPSIVVQRNGQYDVVRAPEGAKLYLARSEDGRFCSAEELKALSGTLEGSGKLFLLDAQSRPLCPAAALNPQ